MSIHSAALLRSAREGMTGVDLPEQIKASALDHLQDWLATDKLAGLVEPSDYTALLRWMVDARQFDLLVDSFYQVIPFGTGGRRGPVGIGPNRINPFTIASSVQGHVEYLRQRFPAARRLSVVVACDVRRFHNLRGTYPDGVPNPLLGLGSRDLARTAAAVYGAAGVKVYCLPEDSEDYLSTPELSFLIRRLGAHGGLNVSASHNHPDDNGSKFYNGEGGQEIPPDDEELASIVERVKEVRLDRVRRTGEPDLLCPVSDAARQAFVEMNLRLRLRSETGRAVIVFTGLHGTGTRTVGRSLEAMGFEPGRQLHYVHDQCQVRSDFRHVKFRSPNPEVPESLERGIALAARTGAHLVLATDPDADRLGGASLDRDGYRFLTGNEFAAILTRYRLDSLAAAGRLPARPLAIKTEVTTDLIRKLVEARNGVVLGDLLVGFKYIANVLGSLERTGRFRDLSATLDDFILAAEESHGFMLTPLVRDKDAAGAAVVLAELAADLVSRGETVYGYLIDTYKRFGYHANTVRSTVMQGAAGAADIRKIQQALRDRPPRSIGGRAVLEINDYWNQDRHGAFLSETDRSSRNLITFRVEGGIKATIRPSGTEPKNKLYLELAAPPLGPDATREQFEQHRRAVDREVKAFSNRFLSEMLALIGASVPDYAFDVSDLVALPCKAHFGHDFLPEFELKADAVLRGELDDESVGDWIDEALGPYGPDARALVRNGFEAYAAAVGPSGRLEAQRRIFYGRR